MRDREFREIIRKIQTDDSVPDDVIVDLLRRFSRLDVLGEVMDRAKFGFYLEPEELRDSGLVDRWTYEFISELREHLFEAWGRRNLAFIKGNNERLDPVFLPSLIENLRGRTQEKRASAAALLGEIRNPIAIPALIEAFETPINSDELRANVTTALGDIGDRSVIPFLVEVLQESQHYSWAVHRHAAVSLTKFKDMSLFPILRRYVESHADIFSEEEINIRIEELRTMILQDA